MSSNKHPLVSFIIPFYNHNHFVTYTLNSMLEESYPNKEIIIINDGSSNPDDSSITTWIDKHKDDINIKYIKRENKGLTKTLNELISISNGKYIVLCASDDYLINDTVTSRVKILEENPHKSLLLSDAIVIDDHNNKLCDSTMFEFYNGIKENYFDDAKLKNEIITNWVLAGAMYIVKKDLYDEVGSYDESITVEDYDFFLRVVAKDLILFYDEKVSAYRKHDNNISTDYKYKLRFYHDFKYVAYKNHKLFEEPYKSYLLNVSKSYDKLIKLYPFKIFTRNIRLKTKSIRYKIKSLFSKGK